MGDGSHACCAAVDGSPLHRRSQLAFHPAAPPPEVLALPACALPACALPACSPWQSPEYQGLLVESSRKGLLSLNGFLAKWACATAADPRRTLAYAFYLGWVLLLLLLPPPPPLLLLLLGGWLCGWVLVGASAAHTTRAGRRLCCRLTL